ncbi:hypothetical protein MHBO_003816 [Bonamia ostreae]|uniref:Uncharacterized protein n=1 Tax=Bonamia ostreae TaxID=126728 RepID=A0ABV2ARL9_9EUKA
MTWSDCGDSNRIWSDDVFCDEDFDFCAERDFCFFAWGNRTICSKEIFFPENGFFFRSQENWSESRLYEDSIGLPMRFLRSILRSFGKVI